MGPPPRIRRHRYFGVLAPNSPLRTAVTALAPGATIAPPAPIAEPAAEPAHRRAARHTWALLLARIYDRRKSLWDEVFPLRRTHCSVETRIIAFINDASTVRDLVVHRGEPTAPPRIAPARGPPLWDLPEPGRVTSTPTRNLPPAATPGRPFLRRLGQVKSCYAAPGCALWRWIYLSLARARPPWPPRPPGSATTSVRSRPSPPQIDT